MLKEAVVIGVVGGCVGVEEPKCPHPHGRLEEAHHHHGQYNLLALPSKVLAPLALVLLQGRACMERDAMR